MSVPKFVVAGIYTTGIDPLNVQIALSEITPIEIPGKYLQAINVNLKTGEIFRVKKEKLANGITTSFIKEVIKEMKVTENDIDIVEIIIDIVKLNNDINVGSKRTLDYLFYLNTEENNNGNSARNN